MLNLIKESCKEGSDISSMRIANYIALLGVLVPYVFANMGNIVVAFMSRQSVQFIDIPVVAGGIVTAVISAKVIQKATGEKKGGTHG